MKYSAPLITIALLTGSTLAAQEPDWRYTDGLQQERWSEANDTYQPCDAGRMQSPIELDDANAVGNITIAADYGMANTTLKLGTHKVQIDTPAGMGMVSGGNLFNLLQIHFHTPSEHAFSGKRYPLTAHFVHATRDGTLGVLGIMFEEGEANPALQAIIDGMARGAGSTVSLDLGAMIPGKLAVHRYQGSLTTPPCSENVNWHVVDDPVEASAEQIAAFEDALGFSARALQPRNGRLLVAPAE